MRLLPLFGFNGPTQRKSAFEAADVPNRSASDIRKDIGAAVDDATALKVSAAYAAARVIAEGIAQVPCLLQRDTPGGGRVAATDHPLYDLLARQPNSFQTSFEFREWMGIQLALTHNAFAFVTRDTRGRPLEIIPLPASMVSVSSPNFGEVHYRLNVPGKPAYSQWNIWHIKGPSWNAIEGIPFLSVAARALGLSSNLEKFGNQIFENAARPSGVLATDQPLTQEQRQIIGDAWRKQMAGVDNALDTALLSNGLKYQTIQITANEAQWTEARRYQTEEICRIMRVDPLMVMQATNSAAYASIEQRFLAHMTHTIAPWHARIEQSAETALLSRDEQRQGYRVHFDNRSMMRGSSIDRATYLATMKQNGLMSANECRVFEGLDKVPDAEADQLRPAANLYGDPSASTGQPK